MTHIWVQTRDAAKARLDGVTFDVAAATLTPSVEINRAHDPEPEEMPLVNIYTGDEEIPSVTRDDTERLFDMSVECWFAGKLLDDGLGAMAEAVQSVIEADHTLGGAVTRCQYNGATVGRSGDGEIRSGVVKLNFLISAITAFGNPGLRA